MKRFLILMSMMSMLLIIGAGSVFAGGGVNFDLLCPTNVTAGSTFTVTVANIKNWDCSSSVGLSRYMIGFVANPDSNNFGGLGIYGPYQKYLGAIKLVPVSNCTTCTDPNGCPGTIPNFNITTPASPIVGGKMAMVTIMFIRANGSEEIGGGMCLVNLQ